MISCKQLLSAWRCLGPGVTWTKPALKNAYFRDVVQSLLKWNSQAVISALMSENHSDVGYRK